MLKYIPIILIILYSCSNSEGAKHNDKLLEGIWVPEKIEWKSAVEGDSELSKVKFSSFYTFSFKGPEFIVIGSTNTIDNNDSLILASEPGYSLFYGKLRMQDSIVIAQYKKVYSFINIPTDTMRKERTDTFLLKNGYLTYNNERYKPYIKVDTSLINSFWAKAKESK